MVIDCIKLDSIDICTYSRYRLDYKHGEQLEKFTLKKGEKVETNAMQELLSTLGTVVTQVLTWVGSVASTIVQTPLLLVTTGFLMLGGAIGIFGRLLSKN